MLPSGSWTAAIAATVSSTCRGGMSPSTSGSSCSVKASFPPFRHRGSDLLAVEHDALPEHRVQRPLGGERPARVLLDQRTQEVVISANRCRVGVVEPERALQPPVRRMERVRVMRSAKKESGAFQLQPGLWLPVVREL